MAACLHHAAWHRGRRMWRMAAAGTLLVVLALSAGPVRGQSDRHPPSVNDFGGVGLLQTRTARFLEDGTIEVGASFVYPYYRYFVTFQALPWVEATFRYSDIKNRRYSDNPDFSGDQSFKDRGADLKFKLLNESAYLPQIAVGIQDGLGTGLFASEYVVASKRWYDLDVHLGLGWGNLGSRCMFENPLIMLSDRFRTRDTDFGQGGTFSLGSYFSGECVSLFGGVEWHTPVRGLSLKLEFDGNDYQSDPLFNRFEADLPVNFGVAYRPYDWLGLSAGFERGNQIMFRVSLRGDVTTEGMPKFDEAPPEVEPRPRQTPTPPQLDVRQEPPAPWRQPGDPAPVPSSPGDPAPVTVVDGGEVLWGGDEVGAHDGAFDALASAGLEVESVEVVDAEARVYLAGNHAAGSSADAEQAGRIAAKNLPASVERVTVVRDGAAGPAARTSIERADLARAAEVDRLFDGLEARGYEVRSLDISQQEIAVVVSSAGPVDRGTDREAARLLFASLPAPAERVSIVHLRAGVEMQRVVVRRDEVHRTARIDRMFDGLAANGFEIESFEIARGRATVRLAVGAGTTEADLEAAARLVAQSAPDRLQVEVVGLRAGMEAARVTLRRPAAVATAGGAGEPASPSGRQPAAPAPALDEAEKRAIAEKLFAGLEDEGFVVDAVRLDRLTATVYVQPTKFRQAARNIGRAARVVANHAPASVEEIEVVILNAGLETSRVSIMRRDLENAVAGQGSPEEIWANAVIETPRSAVLSSNLIPDDAIANDDRYPSFDWSFRPALRQHVGGPDGFYLFQLYLDLSATAQLYRGLSVSGSASTNLYSTLDKLTNRPVSALPHVRSEIVRYLQEGEAFAITRLQADYIFSPFRNVYGRLSAGLLEPMFGGVGAEVLYRPYGARWAAGVDINRVRQREFKQLFGFQSYEVTTGHANLYYKFPFYDLIGEIHAGQFLAGDRGAQFAISREFDSGVRVGAWATFTNVPFEKFGEGSFDKGFYVTIPLELFLTRSTRSTGTFAFRPLTRDGGQMLGISRRLYPLVESGNLDEVVDEWDMFLD